ALGGGSRAASAVRPRGRAWRSGYLAAEHRRAGTARLRELAPAAGMCSEDRQGPAVHERAELVGAVEPPAQHPAARAAAVADVDQRAGAADVGERVELGEHRRADDRRPEDVEVGEAERPLRPVDAREDLASWRHAHRRRAAAAGPLTDG